MNRARVLPTKRRSESSHKKLPDTKRKKTEKGEKAMGSDKRKIRHIEWEYGRHCAKELWLGKKVKVKIPAKNGKKDDPAEFKFGRLIDIKTENSQVSFKVEWSGSKQKSTDWINLKDDKLYVFGQILFVKNHNDTDQIDFIKNLYGWKGKDRKAIPIPVVELISANDEEKRIIPIEDPDLKIPLQYFNIDKAKKLRQSVLFDYREYKDEYFSVIRDSIKDGDKLYAKIMSYKKHYSQWIEKHSKIEIDVNESLQKFCTKIVRVYKGDRNCGKAIILR